jgi:membrane protein YdbS with pleckstrin-like domain
VVTSHRGFLDAILGLSDITIETIGGKLKFTHIPGAEHLQERILDQRTRVQQEARREEREAIRAELLKVLQPPPPPSVPASVVTGAQPAASPRAKPTPSLRERLRPKLRLEKPGEIIWRKHWLLLIGRLIGPVALLLAGPILSIVLSQLHNWFPRAQLPVGGILAPLLLIPPASFWIWWAYAVWGGDVYILTTDRIVDIERTPLGLKETRRESTLDRIQDIEVNISGVWARVFDIGNVNIKTAGGDFTFRAVADPRGVQRDIFHRLAEFRRKEQEQRRRQTMEEMTRWLSVYNELTTVPTQAGAEEKESG